MQISTDNSCQGCIMSNIPPSSDNRRLIEYNILKIVWHCLDNWWLLRGIVFMGWWYRNIYIVLCCRCGWLMNPHIHFIMHITIWPQVCPTRSWNQSFVDGHDNCPAEAPQIGCSSVDYMHHQILRPKCNWPSIACGLPHQTRKVDAKWQVFQALEKECVVCKDFPGGLRWGI